MNRFCYYDEAYTITAAKEFGWCRTCGISSCKYSNHYPGKYKNNMKNHMDMTPNDYIKIIEKKDAEIQRLRKIVEEVTENIKIVGAQNTKLKKKCDRYKKVMNRFYGEGLFNKNVMNEFVGDDVNDNE